MLAPELNSCLVDVIFLAVFSSLALWYIKHSDLSQVGERCNVPVLFSPCRLRTAKKKESMVSVLNTWVVFIKKKRLSGFCHTLEYVQTGLRDSVSEKLQISLSLPLQRSDYGDWSCLVCCWHAIVFFRMKYTCSPFLSQHHVVSLMCVCVFFSCRDGMKVCRQAAVIW